MKADTDQRLLLLMQKKQLMASYCTLAKRQTEMVEKMLLEELSCILAEKQQIMAAVDSIDAQLAEPEKQSADTGKMNETQKNRYHILFEEIKLLVREAKDIDDEQSRRLQQMKLQTKERIRELSLAKMGVRAYKGRKTQNDGVFLDRRK